MAEEKGFYGIKLGNTEIGVNTGIFKQMDEGIRNTKKRKRRENKKYPYRNRVVKGGIK